MASQDIRSVQAKILEIMTFIDELCRRNGIIYYVMGGTALGAVRHGGFIPWDDDLDIFMTPDNYAKFKKVFDSTRDGRFVLQEWRIVDEYLEYAKVRMNGTTFIEESFRHRKDMHHGIYVDIMILHKCPTRILAQKVVYYVSKYLTAVALSQRNWRPKTWSQKLALGLMRVLPSGVLSRLGYKLVYRYDSLSRDYAYCYFITKANFRQGIFPKDVFADPVDLRFEDVALMGPTDVRRYLEIRYGDYMKLPPVEQRRAAVHAAIVNTEVGYEELV